MTGMHEEILRDQVERAIDDVFVRWRVGLGGQRPQEAIRDAVLAALVASTTTEGPGVDLLTGSETEYRVHLPENGGETLLVRRQAVAQGAGWAATTYGYGGGLAWTMEGWQDAVSALSLDRLFCWPDAATAVAEARRGLALDEKSTS